MYKELFFDENSRIIISENVLFFIQKGRYAVWAWAFFLTLCGAFLIINSIVQNNIGFAIISLIPLSIAALCYGTYSKIGIFPDKKIIIKTIYFFSFKIYEKRAKEFIDSTLWISNRYGGRREEFFLEAKSVKKEIFEIIIFNSETTAINFQKIVNKAELGFNVLVK